MTTPAAHQHVIVIGGSIAGLLTASALTQHFAKVTLIERDSLPRSADERAGTPQSKHPHNVLTRGMKIMESLIPGLEADLRAHGVTFANWGKNVRTLTQSGWLEDLETDLSSPVVSRALLEWLIRKHLLTVPTISFIENAQVQALLADESRQTIVGVTVKPRTPGAAAYDLTADFVVDASGRSSKSNEWLNALGYGTPTETTVDPKVGYATRLYKKPASYDKPWNIVYMPAKAPGTRGGAIFEIEGGIWMIALGGYAEDYPPNDEAGFIAYAKTLAEPDIYDAILLSAEPLGDIVGYRRTLNIVRHYEKMPRFPERFAVTGDAVCGFNPIYGQGMTAAAMGAELLGDSLTAASGLNGVGRAFQAKLAKQNEVMWLMSTGEDFRHASTVGTRPGWTGRLIQRYMDWVIEILPFKDDAAVRFLHVVNLDMPPTALFHPSILGAVLRYRFGKRARPQLSASAPLEQPR